MKEESGSKDGQCAACVPLLSLASPFPAPCLPITPIWVQLTRTRGCNYDIAGLSVPPCGRSTNTRLGFQW